MVITGITEVGDTMTDVSSEKKFVFIPPPEAPVFEPTWDEFKDPAAYIERLKDVGERTGIIKIKPPPVSLI